MAIDTSRFNQKLLEADDIDGTTLADEPFSGLDLRAAACFGYAAPKETGWKFMADQIEDAGVQNIDLQALDKSLTKDVERSYLKVASFRIANVDDDMEYSLWFDNNKALWRLEVLDSPKAEIDSEELSNFFKSSLVKKIAKKTYYRLLDAKKTYLKNVKPEIENGNMLLVDVIKLEAIVDFLQSENFMQNILTCKYLGI